MGPEFVSQMGKKLRRRSLASFFSPAHKTEASSGESNASSNGTAPSSGSVTPLSDQHSDAPVDELTKQSPSMSNQRPPLQHTDQSRRHSGVVSNLGTPSPTGSSSKSPLVPLSQYAPHITNICDNARVCQKAILIQGTIGEDPSQNKLNGTVTVARLDDSFPPTRWPVTESYFRVLLHLTPGPNKFQLEFTSPKLPNTTMGSQIHVSYVNLVMIPPTGTPPLQLALVLAKDSPATFGSVPARVEKEGNGLETAIQKFRMAAYLWQAFTANEMASNKLGRRTFRFEEEWVTGTSNHDDMESGTMRSEARVHVFRTDKTVVELRALDHGMRNLSEAGGDPTRSELFQVAADAVRKGFKPLAGQKHYVAAMLLDSHWDPETKEVTAHVAAGGRHGDLGLAVFGSHCLQSYPGSFQEVVPAFTDCTPVDTKYVYNHVGEIGKSWEVANLGIGGHLRQIGRMFGCREQESGIMNDDMLLLNRSFTSREAYSSRTKSRGGLVLPEHQGRWHRLDCLRFFHHACFRLPGQLTCRGDESIQAWPVEGGNLTLTAPTGIAFVEVFVGDAVCCSHWNEYFSDQNANTTRQVTLSEQSLREKLLESERRGKLRIGVGSVGGGYLEIDDFCEFSSGIDTSFRLATGKVAFRGKPNCGQPAEPPISSNMAEDQEVVWSSAVIQNRLLRSIKVHHCHVISALEFLYDDGSSQLLGTIGQKSDALQDIFELDTVQGEYVAGFFLWSSCRIDALQIATSLGRRSPSYGNRFAGHPQTMTPPRGFTICGVAGRSNLIQGSSVLQNISILITR